MQSSMNWGRRYSRKTQDQRYDHLSLSDPVNREPLKTFYGSSLSSSPFSSSPHSPPDVDHGARRLLLAFQDTLEGLVFS